MVVGYALPPSALVRLTGRLVARTAPLAVAAGLSAWWLAEPGGSGDLAAHLMRAELVAEDRLTLWNAQWFGGHHTLAYTALFPQLAALVGVRVAGAVSVLATVALFELLVHRHIGYRATPAALWMGVAAPGMLVMGQLPFALGTALALGALLALPKRAPLAAGLAVATALASPLAAAFLTIGCIASGLARRRSRPEFVVAGAAAATVVALVVAFPEGGTHEFTARDATRAAVVVAAALVVAPRRWRAGILVYAACLLGSGLIATPVGGTAARLAFWMGGPLIACAAVARLGWRRAAIAAVGAAVAAAWQWSTIDRAAGGLESPSSRPAFYEPLLRFLDSERRRDPRPWRVEIPMTAVRWEAYTVARRFPIARGWYRQLDRRHNGIFYGAGLSHARYEAWLRANAVRFVALPRAPLDPSGVTEQELVASRPHYLRERWSAGGWRVFDVLGAVRFARPEGRARIDAVSLGRHSVTLRVRRPGAAVVSVRWSPYWRVDGGCAEPADGWTRVVLRRRGVHRLTFAPSAERLVARGRRCS